MIEGTIDLMVSDFELKQSLWLRGAVMCAYFYSKYITTLYACIVSNRASYHNNSTLMLSSALCIRIVF